MEDSKESREGLVTGWIVGMVGTIVMNTMYQVYAGKFLSLQAAVAAMGSAAEAAKALEGQYGAYFEAAVG